MRTQPQAIRACERASPYSGERKIRGTGAHDVMASSFSAGVSAALRRHHAPRAGSAPGEGRESTGSTTTHLRTTHDRERLCARSGCGRKNDVRHGDYSMPRSSEQCKPAMRPMMRASHRRITVEPIRGTDYCVAVKSAT